MNIQGRVYDDLRKMIAKVAVLRDSCTGLLHTNKSDPDSMWLKGAEAMLKEAVDELQEILPGIKEGSA